MFGEAILQFEIHVGQASEILDFQGDFSTCRAGGSGFAAFGLRMVEFDLIPPMRQRKRVMDAGQRGRFERQQEAEPMPIP